MKMTTAAAAAEAMVNELLTTQATAVRCVEATATVPAAEGKHATQDTQEATMHTTARTKTAFVAARWGALRTTRAAQVAQGLVDVQERCRKPTTAAGPSHQAVEMHTKQMHIKPRAHLRATAQQPSAAAPLPRQAWRATRSQSCNVVSPTCRTHAGNRLQCQNRKMHAILVKNKLLLVNRKWRSRWVGGTGER